MKLKPNQSKKIRDSARDQPCCAKIPHVCNRNRETTVLCHWKYGQVGKGEKNDLSAFYACSDCHDYLDGRNRKVMLNENVLEWYVGRAIVRTHILMLRQDGLAEEMTRIANVQTKVSPRGRS